MVVRKMMTVLAATSAALMAAGCSAGGSAAAPPPPPAPLHGAPHVEHPLDTAKYQQDPCQLVGEDAAKKLQIGDTADSSNDDPLGPSCDWHGPNMTLTSVSIATNNPAGLSFIYSTRNKFREFREYPSVEGYPAVAALNLPEKSGRCDLDLGVSDKQFITVSVDGGRDQKPKPCDRAKQVAGEVVKTLEQTQA